MNENPDVIKKSYQRGFLIVLALFAAVMVVNIIVISEPGPQEDNSNTVTITTWLDANADGTRNEGEPPLGSVCVWTGIFTTENNVIRAELENCTSRSDANGIYTKGPFNDIFCNQIFSYAKPPEGYVLTTDYSHRGCEVNFGFVEGAAP